MRPLLVGNSSTGGIPRPPVELLGQIGSCCTYPDIPNLNMGDLFSVFWLLATAGQSKSATLSNKLFFVAGTHCKTGQTCKYQQGTA